MEFKEDVVIGLEIHIGLNTKTKLFCGCPMKGSDEPNSRTCEVCLGMPGSKPVLNKKVVEEGTKVALALNCNIAKELVFSRKSYFYPDLAKNYQITQYELPLGEKGFIELPSGKKIGITRVHLEEDPAALVHQKSMAESKFVLVDYNRSGSPLCEIVTEPNIASPEEAREFMKALLNILNYLEVFDQITGTIKADCNLSIKTGNYVRSEIKNVTGFRDIEKALTAELKRQQQAVEEGERLIQDTRGWNAELLNTFRMRTKETEQDYGYILDPDLVSTDMTDDYVNSIKNHLPELPVEKAKKFIKRYKIAKEDAFILASEKHLAHLFEKVCEKIEPKVAVRWLRHELSTFLNAKEKTFNDVEADESHMIELITLVAEKKINDGTAREILEKLVDKPFSPNEYMIKNNLGMVSDTSELEGFCKQIIKEHPEAVGDYKGGNAKSLNFLMGKVMMLSQGKASPGDVVKILKGLID